MTIFLYIFLIFFTAPAPKKYHPKESVFKCQSIKVQKNIKFHQEAVKISNWNKWMGSLSNVKTLKLQEKSQNFCKNHENKQNQVPQYKFQENVFAKFFTRLSFPHFLAKDTHFSSQKKVTITPFLDSNPFFKVFDQWHTFQLSEKNNHHPFFRFQPSF